MPRYQIPARRRSPATRLTLIGVLLLLLFSARSFATYAIEIQWWKELGQFNTWLSMLYYSLAPLAVATRCRSRDSFRRCPPKRRV